MDITIINKQSNNGGNNNNNNDSKTHRLGEI